VCLRCNVPGGFEIRTRPPLRFLAAPRRPARHGAQTGVTLVEFALLAPLFFLLVMGLVITGIVVTNQVQLNNVVRDAARVAGACGSNSDNSEQVPNTAGHTACTFTDIQYYVTHHLNAVPANTLNVSVSLTLANGQSGSDLSQCSKGLLITVHADYPQDLYLPLVGKLLGTPGRTDGARVLSADAQAACAQ
jgi:Flp pilus assembly protein TadG